MDEGFLDPVDCTRKELGLVIGPWIAEEGEEGKTFSLVGAVREVCGANCEAFPFA